MRDRLDDQPGGRPAYSIVRLRPTWAAHPVKHPVSISRSGASVGGPQGTRCAGAISEAGGNVAVPEAGRSPRIGLVWRKLRQHFIHGAMGPKVR